MQALQEGRVRQRRIAAALNSAPAAGGGPPAAFLERAVPRILTEDGRLTEDERATPSHSLTAASLALVCSHEAGPTVPASLRTGPTQKATMPAVATLTVGGNSTIEALQRAKRRALALADALSTDGGPTAAAAAAAAAVWGDGDATEQAEACSAPREDAEEVAACSTAVCDSEPQLHRGGGPAEGRDTAEAPEGGDLALLLSDYVNDEDNA